MKESYAKRPCVGFYSSMWLRAGSFCVGITRWPYLGAREGMEGGRKRERRGSWRKGLGTAAIFKP